MTQNLWIHTPPLPLPQSSPQKPLAGNQRLHKKWAGLQTRSLTDYFDPDYKAPPPPDTGDKPSTPNIPAKPKRPQIPTAKLAPGKPTKSGLQVQTYTIQKYVPRKSFKAMQRNISFTD